MSDSFTTLGELLKWQKARYNDDRAPLLTGLNIMLIALTTVAVALRLWVRKLTKSPWMNDDLLIVISLVRKPMGNSMRLRIDRLKWLDSELQCMHCRGRAQVVHRATSPLSS